MKERINAGITRRPERVLWGQRAVWLHKERSGKRKEAGRILFRGDSGEFLPVLLRRIMEFMCNSGASDIRAPKLDINLAVTNHTTAPEIKKRGGGGG